jgi:hypothetical protein
MPEEKLKREVEKELTEGIGKKARCECVPIDAGPGLCFPKSCGKVGLVLRIVT